MVFNNQTSASISHLRMLLLGVRIFPGQDPTHVYVGWVTTQYHLHSKDFNQSQVLKTSVVIVDDYDRVRET